MFTRHHGTMQDTTRSRCSYRSSSAWTSVAAPTLAAGAGLGSTRRVLHVSRSLGVVLALIWALQPSDAHAQQLVGPDNGAVVSATPTFDWGDVAGTMSYTLEITGANGDPISFPGLAHSSYTVDAGDALLEANSPYIWKVRAFDSGGGATSSAARSFTVDSTPPTAFDLMGPADDAWTTTAGALLSWEVSTDAGAGLDNYDLYLDGSPCRDPWYEPFPNTTTSVSLTETAACSEPPQGAHTWNVVAVDGVGNSTWSNQGTTGDSGWTVNIGLFGEMRAAVSGHAAPHKRNGDCYVVGRHGARHGGRSVESDNNVGV